MSKIIINCETGYVLPLEKFGHTLIKLKKRKSNQIQRLKKSILQYGFSFPIFVWQSKENENVIIDGECRYIVLTNLKKLGYEIPPIPVSYIDAADIQSAKQKLLEAHAQYGYVTPAGMAHFVSDMGNYDFEQIAQVAGLNTKEIQSVLNKFKQNDIADDIQDIHIQQCPHCHTEYQFLQ
jgi:ParB-like chromosome segregation protein Spo0J